VPERLTDMMTSLLPGGIIAHLFTIAGFMLAFFLVARLMSEKRAPANTFAWLLGIIFIPWIGVPLYLLIGGRKLRKVAQRKQVLCPVLPGAGPASGTTSPTCAPVANTVSAFGVCQPVGGNKVSLIATGEEDFVKLEELIESARHSIHLMTFILSPDSTGQRVVDLLAKRAREGIRVRLLLDGLGCFRTAGHFVDPLRKAGGEVARFMPVLPFTSRGSANLRNHRKITIVDHITAMIGGRNLAREYMGPLPYPKRFRDLGAVIEGPGAVLLNEVFIADWCFAARQPADRLHAEIPADVVQVRGHGDLQVVASGPDVPGDPLYEGIISMIQEAERSVWIVTPYFIPDDVLQRSLIVKARAGRDVTLVLPAQSNHPVTDFARRYYIRELRKAGARVLLYTGGMMHAKAVIIDDRVGLIGSANFDLRSLFVNFEVGVLIYSRPEILALRAWAENLMSACSVPEPDPNRHLVRGIAEDLSRLLAPLL